MPPPPALLKRFESFSTAYAFVACYGPDVDVSSQTMALSRAVARRPGRGYRGTPGRKGRDRRSRVGPLGSQPCISFLAESVAGRPQCARGRRMSCSCASAASHDRVGLACMRQMTLPSFTSVRTLFRFALEWIAKTATALRPSRDGTHPPY